MSQDDYLLVDESRDQLIERPMPSSPESEAAILGSIIVNNALIVQVRENFPTSDPMYVSRHRRILDAMYALDDVGSEINPILIGEELKKRGELESVGGITFITSLTYGLPHFANINSYAKIVREKFDLRRIAKICNKAVSSALEEDDESSAILDELSKGSLEISSQSNQKSFVTLGSIVHENLQQAHAIQEQGTAITGVATGLINLDAMTLGLQKSDMIVIAARPSIGKTALSVQMSQHAGVNDNNVVAYFSLEMSKEQMGKRFLCNMAGVDSQRLRSGYLSPEEWERLHAAEQTFQNSRIFIEDTPGINTLQMRAKARRLAIEQGEIGLMVVDYIQLMSGSSRRAESRQQEITQISRELKALAKEMNVPLIALSQLSRAPENRTDHRPQLSDLRESGCLTGDTLIPIHTGELIPIKNLAENNLFQGIWSMNNYSMKKTSATNAFSTGVKEVWELTTHLGKKLKCTKDHKFFSRDGWKPLSQFMIDEEIATPAVIPVNNQEGELTDHELILAGHLIGDGCMIPRRSVSYTTGKIHLLNLVSETAKEIFGDKIKLVTTHYPTWHCVGFVSSQRVTHGVRNPSCIWSEKLGIYGFRSHEKRVPSAIFHHSDRQIGLFLRHLWSTDGHIGFKEDRKRTGAKITCGAGAFYSSTSRRLADEVQALLTRLGIRSRLKTNKGASGHPWYNIHILTRKSMMRFLDTIGTIEGDPRREVENKIRAWNSTCKSSDAWSLKQDGDILWDKVSSIVFAGEEEVFDLTVPEGHNFVANGIIAHNSIEQDADVVAFIYREDKYKPHNDPSELTHTAEIILSKQRNGPTGTVIVRFNEVNGRFENMYHGN